MKNIVATPLFEQQLTQILTQLAQQDLQAAKAFKLYLDTVLINMETKVTKYKLSTFFNDENIRDIEHQGFTIPFYIDEQNNNFSLLGIVKK